MRALCTFVAVVLSIFFWTQPVRAERELIVPFHEGGHIVFDQLAGLRLSTTSGFSYAGPLGVAFQSTKLDALAPNAPATEIKTTTLWLAPSADIFVTDHLSIGGLVEIGHSWGSVQTGDQRIELPGTTSMTFLPRIGFYAPFGDRLGLWPRAGVGWSSVESARFVSTGSPAVRESFRSMVLDLDLALVYRFNETFFMRGGPELGLTLGGQRTEESGGITSGAGASMLQVSGVVGFGMNLEL
jgi:hypothetical protein